MTIIFGVEKATLEFILAVNGLIDCFKVSKYKCKHKS